MRNAEAPRSIRPANPAMRLLSAAAVAMIVLAACGGGDSSSSGSSGGTTATTPAAPAKLTSRITGTVSYSGAVPEMAVLNMAADPVCAALNEQDPKRRQALVLGDNNRVANVVVQVKSNLPAVDHDVPSEPVVFDQGGCQYDPHVFALRVGQPLQILNPDGTLHNVHAFAKVNTEFNEAMPKFRTELEKVFDRAEPVPFAVKCDVHPWMNAFAAVFDHPYFAVTGTDGSFTIEGLPAGTYEIEVWHERLPAQTATVTVGEDASATADFTMAVPS